MDLEWPVVVANLRRSSRPPTKVTVFAALIALAVLVNLFEFRGIDRFSPDNVDAIRRENVGDTLAITYQKCGWCNHRYAPHIALGFAAPGATVIVPGPSAYAKNRTTREELTARLLVWGRAARVEWATWPAADGALVSPRSPDGFDPTPYVVARGNGGTKGAAWVLAVDPSRGAQDRTAGQDPDTFVDRALATTHGPADRTPSGRTFVLLTWNTSRPGARAGPQDALVELSLLPEPLRTELAP
jgi:hypothetical protein